LEISNIYIATGICSLLSAIWIMIPAYVPNPAAVLFGGGTPVDLGTKFIDGRRLLGDGKTYRGFVCGVIAGVAAGLAEMHLQAWAGWHALPAHTLLSISLLATGALAGDLVKSFIKRRFRKERGEMWIIADQYDLVLGAFAFLLIFDYEWMSAYLTLPVVLWIILLTPLLHRAANLIGNKIGVKDVPW